MIIKTTHVYAINGNLLVVADTPQKTCELYGQFYNNTDYAQCIDSVELVKNKKLGCTAIIEERE